MTKTTITYRRIWNVAYPIILGSIAQNLINFTDTAFLGRVGEVALGAGALGGIFYLAIMMLGMGFGTGAQIIIARRYGENHLKKIGPIIDHSIIFLVILSVLTFSILQYGMDALLKVAVQSEAVFEATVDYMNIRSFGVFFAFLNMVLRAFYVGLAKTKVITYTTFVMAVANIILDYILIFGHWGAPEMGIEGAALASVIAEAVALVFFFIYTASSIKFKDYALFRFVHITFKQMMAILRISVPMMMQSFISLSVWFVFFLFIEKLGETSLAVSNIIRSVFVLLMMPIWGFATATNTLVSYLIGLNKQDEVMALIRKIAVLTFAGVSAIVSFGLVFPKLVLEIYTNNAVLVEMGVPVLYIVSLGALFLSIGFIYFNGVSGTGKTNISLSIEIIVLGIYLIYTYMQVYFYDADITWVWTAELIYGFLLALFSFSYLKTNRWKHAKV
jgi:putative MATE family efflux protein